jgi:hypothetical protein
MIIDNNTAKELSDKELDNLSMKEKKAILRQAIKLREENEGNHFDRAVHSNAMYILYIAGRNQLYDLFPELFDLISNWDPYLRQNAITTLCRWLNVQGFKEKFKIRVHEIFANDKDINIKFNALQSWDYDINSKFNTYEIVEVNKLAIESVGNREIEICSMTKAMLKHLLESPIATIKNKIMNDKGEWSYVVYFLGSDAQDLVFREEDLKTTGKFTKPSKFKQFEIIKITRPSKENKELQYFIGVITGFCQDIGGDWGYGISLKDYDEHTLCEEYELETTGEFTTREDFYGETTTSIKVIVTPDGKGELKKEQDNENIDTPFEFSKPKFNYNPILLNVIKGDKSKK